MGNIKTFNKLSESERAELKRGVIEVEGKAMNRTALGVVDALLRLYPELTFDELKQMLPDTINTAAPRNFKSLFSPHTQRLYGVVQSGKLRKESADSGFDISSTHFIGEGETFKTKDGVEVLVSKVWESQDSVTGQHDLQNLIDHVAQYGIKVVSFESTNKAFKRGEYSIEVINPLIYNKIRESTETTSKPKWLLILLIILFLLILAGVVYGITRKEESSADQTPPDRTTLTEEIKEEPVVEQTPFEELKSDIVAGKKSTGKSISFEEILFDYNSYELLPEAETHLSEVLEALNEVSGLTLHIVGHTSNEGRESVNNRLSRKRAEAIMDYLVSKGINQKRLSAEGKGDNEPVADNSTEEGKKKNRRIEFIVKSDGLE
jgi:outer membrane protein OmpA-like peptidoglycan-associated protein